MFCLISSAAFSADSAAHPATQAHKSVIGGQSASILNYPYVAMILEIGEGYICSGTVISPTRILTAAHCTTGDHSRLSVVTGRSDVSDVGGQVSGVSAVIRHPGYAETRKGVAINDVAVLVLSSSTTALPASLPTTSEDAILTQSGAVMTLAAFGERRKDFRRRSRVATLAAAPLFSRTSCTNRYPGFSASTMICASGEKFITAFSGRKSRAVHRSGCFGDSGGPLLGFTSDGVRVLGVVSFGGVSPPKFFFVRCGLRRYPGAFTRVSAFLPFIQTALSS